MIEAVTSLGGLNIVHIFFVMSSVFMMAIGCVGVAIAQGRVISHAFDGMARQPEIAGEIRFTMIIGLAMLESLAIYCLLISLIILFQKWN